LADHFFEGNKLAHHNPPHFLPNNLDQNEYQKVGECAEVWRNFQYSFLADGFERMALVEEEQSYRCKNMEK
jgi:hypothetical protein